MNEEPGIENRELREGRRRTDALFLPCSSTFATYLSGEAPFQLLFPAPCSRSSKSNPPHQDVLEHHPVAEEGIERVLEGGGAIFFEKEMSHPGKSIAAEQGAQQPPGIALDDEGNHPSQYTAAADEMQPS